MRLVVERVLEIASQHDPTQVVLSGDIDAAVAVQRDPPLADRAIEIKIIARAHPAGAKRYARAIPDRRGELRQVLDMKAQRAFKRR